MSQIITASFSIGDVAYFPLFATASIYPVQITDVYLKNIQGVSTVIYDLLRLDKGFVLQGIPQDQVLPFPQAQTTLLAYLAAKTTEITNMVAPSV